MSKLRKAGLLAVIVANILCTLGNMSVYLSPDGSVMNFLIVFFNASVAGFATVVLTQICSPRG